MAEKKERAITPVGEVKWANVHSPKAAYVDPNTGKSKGDPKYQIDLVFDPADPEWKAWAGALTARIRALPEQIDKKTGEALKKNQPIKRELDQDDKPTGRYYVTFKTGVQFRPSVYDRTGQPISEKTMIGNGSLARVNYTPSEYDGFGGGVALYLNAVQVVKLIEHQPPKAEAFGFPVEPPESSNGFEDFATDPEDDGLPF